MLRYASGQEKIQVVPPSAQSLAQVEASVANAALGAALNPQLVSGAAYGSDLSSLEQQGLWPRIVEAVRHTARAGVTAAGSVVELTKDGLSDVKRAVVRIVPSGGVTADDVKASITKGRSEAQVEEKLNQELKALPTRAKDLTDSAAGSISGIISDRKLALQAADYEVTAIDTAAYKGSSLVLFTGEIFGLMGLWFLVLGPRPRGIFSVWSSTYFFAMLVFLFLAQTGAVFLTVTIICAIILGGLTANRKARHFNLSQSETTTIGWWSAVSLLALLNGIATYHVVFWLLWHLIPRLLLRTPRFILWMFMLGSGLAALGGALPLFLPLEFPEQGDRKGNRNRWLVVTGLSAFALISGMSASLNLTSGSKWLLSPLRFLNPLGSATMDWWHVPVSLAVWCATSGLGFWYHSSKTHSIQPGDEEAFWDPTDDNDLSGRGLDGGSITPAASAAPVGEDSRLLSTNNALSFGRRG